MNEQVMLFASFLAAMVYGVVGSSYAGQGSNHRWCDSIGKFPMSGQCQVYYQCQYLGGSDSTVLYPQCSFCPEGTVFDNSVSACREASLVISRPECLGSEDLPSTEAPPEDLSVSEAMANIISDAREVCYRIRSVNAYKAIVLSKRPLTKSLDTSQAKKLNEYIMGYQQALTTVQAHVGVWRQGEDIVTIYELIKRYEIELAINFGQLMAAASTSDRQIQGLIEYINQLNADIENNISAGVATARPEHTIAEMRRRLAIKKDQLQDHISAALEFEQVVSFLVLVRSNTSKILDRCVASRTILEDLHRNVLKDKNAFLGYAINVRNVRRDIMSLETEEEQQQKNKEDKQKEMENLEKDKAQLQTKVDDLNKAFDDIGKHIEKNRKKYNKKKNMICKVGGPYESDCEAALSVFSGVYGIDRLNQEMDDFNGRRSQLLTEIDNLLPQFADLNRNMEELINFINIITNRISEINMAIQAFNRFLLDVDNICLGIITVLPAIQDKANGLQKVEYAFNVISNAIDEMFEQAKRDENDTGKLNEKKHIIKALASLQEQIENSSAMISDVGQC